MKPSLFLVPLLALSPARSEEPGPPSAQEEALPAPLLATGFDLEGNDPLRDQLAKHRHTALENGALRVRYVGYQRGSERVVMRTPLGESSEAKSLCFDVRFRAGFDFAKGGKLHGLGPTKPVTGGNPMTPTGWSARVTFRKGGGIATYLYRQDKRGRYGATHEAKRFRFTPDHWHAVTLQVSLNTPGKTDGSVRLFVDGELLVEDKGVRFRDAGGAESEVSRLLFSTFHGGQSPEFAPRDADGNFATEHAHFDNFAVHEGIAIRSAPLDR